MGALVLIGGLFSGLFLGIPVAVALGLFGIITIFIADLAIISVPTTVYAGIAKYPLLAVPMFVLAGTIFERSGMAERLLKLALAIIGTGRGSLPVIAIVVAMLMGGISGSGPAIAAAVAAIMTSTMIRAGYPRPFTASVIAGGAATDILVPPSIALIIYSILVPQATVPAMFAAGIVPGTLAGLFLIIPTIWMARRFPEVAPAGKRPPFWASFYEAFWPLLAKVVILGGLRYGLFTPTEAGVIAVAYALFVAIFIYKSVTFRSLVQMFITSAELSGIILIVIALASVFGYALQTLGIIEPVTAMIVNSRMGETGALIMIMLMLLAVGMFIDGASILLIMVPLVLPIAIAFQWDLVWFGIMMVCTLAIGAITPPMAINLFVTCRFARVSIESTVPYVIWLVAAMVALLGLVVLVPDVALWLPRVLDLHG